MKKASPIAQEDLLNGLAQRVRENRKARGMTARDLAEASGLSLRFVAQLEAGQANIAIGRLASVASALGLPLREIVDIPAENTDPFSKICSRLSGCSPEEMARVERAIALVLGDRVSSAVALLGLRGAGKSSIGPRLAHDLAVPFVELDDLVERAAGLSLAEIFALHGEGYYRRLESECLLETLSRGGGPVIATSGGIVQNENARALLEQYCSTVWLKADPEDHMRRVLEQGDKRPTEGRANAMDELRALLASREPFYRLSDICVDTSELGLEESTRNIVSELRHEPKPAHQSSS